MQSSFGVMLDPVQSRLTQFPCGRFKRCGVFNSIQALPRENLR
jgi:hypothetical protein